MKWLGIIFAAITFLLHPMQPVFAVCESFTLLDVNGKTIANPFAVDSEKTLTISFNLSDSKPPDYQTTGWFKVYLSPGPTSDRITPANSKISYVVTGGILDPGKNYSVELRYDEPGKNDRTICTRAFTTTSTSSSCSIAVSPSAPSSTETITTTVDMNTEETGYDLYYDPSTDTRYSLKKNVEDGYSTKITNHGIGNATLFIAKAAMLSKRLCETSFTVTEQGGNALEAQFTDLCSYAEDEANEDCLRCVNGENPGIWTAIGCVPSTLDGFVKTILPFGMALGGGIAFLLMLFGALQIMTSAGNPEKLNAGKELVTSAIVGLLLIIFSVFLLKIIGADILGIPGFS